MEAFIHAVQALDLHPLIDHFTISLLLVGVAIDLVASLAPSRTWLRYMALTLMVLGAISAGASYVTGDLEHDRLRKMLTRELHEAVHWHEELAESTTVVFAVLAVWRIMVEATGFMAGSRPLYLLVAIIGAGLLSYTGHLGHELVFEHGIGTDLLKAALTEGQAAPAKSAPPSIPTEALPTVSVAAPSPAQAQPKPTPGLVHEPKASPPPAPAAPPAASPAPKG